jgi:stage III sporulation protein AB
MLDLIGALLVLFAGTALGFHISAQYADRPKQLRLLLHALQRLETEIAYGLTPLPEALGRIAAHLTEPLAGLFRTAAEQMGGMQSTDEAWKAAVEQCWKHTAMKTPEKDVLIQLGQSLGGSDSGDQIKHLQLAMRMLRMEEENAAEDQRKYAKMWKSLGVLCGALVVILVY